MSFLIITGMSGSGKSQVVDALEDIGYYCVDNVPPLMLSSFAELTLANGGPIENLALVVDARGQSMFATFAEELEALRSRDIDFRLIFLNANDDVLLKRYKEGRRRHPLSEYDGGSIESAIRRERGLLESALRQADLVIDSSLTTIGQLKSQITEIFSADTGGGMLVRILSFGYKYGLPSEADLVFDLRCLPNPFYVDALREHTGLDQQVKDYVMQWPQSRELLARLFDMLDFLLPLYTEEGKSQLVVAIGCTGGKHRSVTFAEAIGAHLQERFATVIQHRDVQKSAIHH